MDTITDVYLFMRTIEMNPYTMKVDPSKCSIDAKVVLYDMEYKCTFTWTIVEDNSKNRWKLFSYNLEQ